MASRFLALALVLGLSTSAWACNGFHSSPPRHVTPKSYAVKKARAPKEKVRPAKPSKGPSFVVLANRLIDALTQRVALDTTSVPSRE